MDCLKLMEQRHSVRHFKEQSLDVDSKKEITSYLEKISNESGLDIIPVYDEPDCFDSLMGHYGHFEGVRNYVVISGKNTKTLGIRTGYYGEKVVLKIQEMGLHSCWVALTRGRIKADIKKGNKVSVIIAFGYGTYKGAIRKSKTFEDVSKTPYSVCPEWYRTGIKYSLLAPTAMNQQKFKIELKDDKAYGRAEIGFYTKMDLGIIKCHFELSSGNELIVDDFE